MKPRGKLPTRILERSGRCSIRARKFFGSKPAHSTRVERVSLRGPDRRDLLRRKRSDPVDYSATLPLTPNEVAESVKNTIDRISNASVKEIEGRDGALENAPSAENLAKAAEQGARRYRAGLQPHRRRSNAPAATDSFAPAVRLVP